MEYLYESVSGSKLYHYVYETKNLINGKIYIGKHSTYDLNDLYLGSGEMLLKAINTYGHHNFSNKIIKTFYTSEEAFDYERYIVDEHFVKRKDTYNLKVGGEGGWYHLKGKIPVRLVGVDRYISIDIDEYYNNKHLYQTSGYGLVTIKTTYGYVNIPRVEYDPNKHSTQSTGKISVKDKCGNYYQVDKNDPRYVSGELVPVWTGNKHSEETIEKMKYISKVNKRSQGDKNSQYGTIFVHNINDMTYKRVSKSELDSYIKSGWSIGGKSRLTNHIKTLEKVKRSEEKIKIMEEFKIKRELESKFKDIAAVEKYYKRVMYFNSLYEEYKIYGLSGVKEKYGWNNSQPNLIQNFHKFVEAYSPTHKNGRN